MNLNLFSIIDGMLADYASPRARRAIHGLILLAGILVTIWLAVGGDWEKAVAAALASLYAGANRANTGPED